MRVCSLSKHILKIGHPLYLRRAMNNLLINYNLQLIALVLLLNCKLTMSLDVSGQSLGLATSY